MHKLFSTKNVVITTLVLAIMGMAVEGIHFMNEVKYPMPAFTKYLEVFSLINMSSMVFLVRRFDWLIGFNFFLYICLLWSAIETHKHGLQNGRLLKFMYGIIFANAVVNIIQLSAFWFFAPYSSPTPSPLHYFGGVVRMALIGIYAFKVIKTSQQGRNIAFTLKEINEQSFVKYTDASLAQRFSHQAIDTILALMLFSPIIITISFPILEKISDALGDRTTLYLIMILSLIAYHLFFEGIFNITLSKFLTATRMSTTDGKRAHFGKVLLRTLLRRIPLEPFSALKYAAWHDDYSDTAVYKEQDENRISPHRYWWALLILITSISGYFWLSHKVRDMLSLQKQQRQHKAVYSSYMHLIEHPDTNQIYFLKAKDYEYGLPKVALKIKSFSGDKIKFAVIEDMQISHEKLRFAERLYLDSTKHHSQLEISKSQLRQALTEDYEASFRNPNSADLLQIGKQYTIENIDRLFCPSLRRDGSSSRNGNVMRLGLSNYGTAGKIIAIQDLTDKETHWEASPSELKEAPTENTYYAYSYFDVTATDISPDRYYQVKIVVADPNGKRYSYMLEGVDFDNMLYRID